jgi:hypothetical protein
MFSAAYTFTERCGFSNVTVTDGWSPDVLSMTAPFEI